MQVTFFVKKSPRIYQLVELTGIAVSVDLS